MATEPEVIYIASASRSGSTLIEDYLARRFAGVACGELYRISKFARGNARIVLENGALDTCACRQPVLECEFWRAVSKEADLDLASADLRSQLNRWQRAHFRLCVTVGGAPLTRQVARFFPPFRRELDVGKNCFRIYRAISRVAKVNVILDSSKQAHQYYILKAVAPERLRIVTLIRDGRAVVASMTRGARSQVIAKQIDTDAGAISADHIAAKACRVWMLSTLNALKAFVLTNRDRRVLLHYESFCEDPAAEMRRVAHRFSIPDGEGSQPNESHAIGGSPSRHNSGFKAIRIDKSWKQQMPFRGKSASILCGRLMNKLMGYRK